MSDPFNIVRGDTPLLADNLMENGVAADLTGCTVAFRLQGAGVNYNRTATITNAATGAVEYRMIAADTALVGDYQAQWVVTLPGATPVVRTFPSGFILFSVVESLPVSTPVGVTLLRDLYDTVRAILGDTNPAHRRYLDPAVAQVMRAVLRLNRVPGYTLTADLQGVSPTLTDATALGLLTYHSAKMFLLPNMASYSYRSRAMSESFGEQKHFLFDLENVLFDLQNGGSGGVFVSFQSFYGWINSTTGADLWQRMTELKTNAPVATATIGRDGMTVSV